MVLGAVWLSAVTGVFAQQADDVKGTWVNENKDVKVEFSRTGDQFNGKITWSANMYEADGKTLKKDVNNGKEELRNRTLFNLVIFSGLSFREGEWTGGELYDPKSGKTYKCKMWLKEGRLQIRGYAGMFGKTTEWTRG